MRRLSLAAVLVCAAGLLSACQTALPGKGGADVTPNAVAGDPIEVTALDAPPGDAALSALSAAEPGGIDTAAPQDAPAGPAVETPAGTAAEAPDPAPQPDLVETPVTPKSEMQLACEKRKGRWLKVKGDLRTCVFQTKDGGKRCERESQCESVCLARSRTCAPMKPLYGCHEILQDNGARVTLCLE
jgi:hypothetical protein